MTENRIDSARPQRASKRKRSKDESESNNEESKRRGRPRLDIQEDTSAADRRRTQIRVAQRAYRQRKENTIDELRRQVQELQTTIQSMNQAFGRFSEKFSAASVPSALLVDLQNIVQLSSTGLTHAGSLGSSDSPGVDSHDFKHVHDLNVKDKDLSDVTDFDLPFQTGPVESTWSPLTCPDDAADLSGIVENSRVTISMLRSLDVPDTYSSFERTFARRLHRASCEYAYTLACDPTRAPADFKNLFKLTLRAMGTIDRVKSGLESILSRSAREPLSNWGVTYIHVGGAGTHYDRPPEEGGLCYQSSMPWAVTTVGPHKISGSSIEEALTAEMLLRRVPEIDGEWFDSYDVEGYLVEKGIILDPSSSFAEIELPVEESLSPESSPASSPMDGMVSYMHIFATSEPVTAPSHARYYSGLPKAGFMPPAGLAHKRSYAEVQPRCQHHVSERISTAPVVDQQYGMNMPIHGGMSPCSFQLVPKSRVTIDVGEFMKQMIIAGTCLMRAPGYRRKDVDIALRRAVVHTN